MNKPALKMKQIKLLFVVLLAISLLTGCTITREATLRDAHVRGAINLPPLYLAENGTSGKVKITPHLNYTPSKNIKTYVDPTAYTNKSIKNGTGSSNYISLSKENRTEQTDYSSEGNLTWEIPDITGGLGFEVFLFKSFAITGSYNIASGGSSGSVGLAIQSVKNDIGVRLDGGLLFNHYSYDVYSTVEERQESIFGSHSATYYFHDIGTANSTDYYISLTFNSANRENLIGFLLSLGYFRQTILDYNPDNLDDGYYILYPPLPVTINNNTNLEATAGYLNLLPAIYFNVNEYIRIIGGTRMTAEVEIGSGNVHFWPFFQTEFTF